MMWRKLYRCIMSGERYFTAEFERGCRLSFLICSDTGISMAKKLIQIDVSSDFLCPWCFVGKKTLDNAIDMTKDQFDFEVRWHPFFLEPFASKEGIIKLEFYNEKFGAEEFKLIAAEMTKIFRGLGFEYETSGLTGSTLDSHRLVSFASHQGFDKQNALVEELFINYHCQGKYIGSRQVLLEAAKKVGIKGAEELFEDPSKGLKEVNEEIEKYSSHIEGFPYFAGKKVGVEAATEQLEDPDNYFTKVNKELKEDSSHISGVPYFVINGKYKFSGGQPPEVFLRAFHAAAKDITV